MSQSSPSPPPDVLRALVLDSVEDAVFTTDTDNRVTYWSSSAERMFGYSADEAVGRPFGELLPFEMAAGDEADLLAAVAEGHSWRGEGSTRLPDGRELWIESTVRPLVHEGRIIGSVSISRDRSEARIIERTLEALSAINRALVRTSDEATLLDEVCQIAVELGGYRLAWVGYAEDDEDRTIRRVAWAGADTGYLAAVRVSWGDGPHAQGPGGVAIRTGRAAVVRDIAEPSFAPWQAEARKRGIVSTASLPLMQDGRAFGILAVYCAEPHGFGEAEMRLLEEMSSDLAFGIVARRTRAAHEEALEAIRESEERHRTVVTALAEGIVVRSEDGTVVSANPAARAILGRRATPGTPLRDWAAIREDGTRFPPEEYPAAVTLRTGRPRRNVVLGIPRGDHVRWIAFHSEPVRLPGGGRGSVSSFEDVTHYRDARAEHLFEAQLRAALHESATSVSANAPIEEIAAAICQRVASLPGLDYALLASFVAPDDLRVLAMSAPPDDRTPGLEELSGPDTAALYALASAGPWARRTSDVASARLRAIFAARGLEALAIGPIGMLGAIEGLLVIGTRDRVFGRLLVEKMPALAAFSATSSALLAERMRIRRQEIEQRAVIGRVLAEGSFHPEYQPIVELAERDVVAYEALSRFDDGMRPDLRFRDAWTVGLGPELELATLEAAVAGATGLPPGRWLTLNVSPRLLLQADRLRPILARLDRPLVLEVTEHEPVADYVALRTAVESLGRDLRLAVDDAGAGVANFSHLVELRPDFVKLDISLVRGVNADLGRQALVAAMRQFARSSGCRLIAEGVEEEPEAATLQGFGVDFGQGYLFGRPERIAGA
jgi:PAS domain S-box-containing protein